MGNFYTNYTLRGPSRQAVVAALAGRSAIVTPVEAGCVVVFDERSDDQDFRVITELGSKLSRQLRCPVLAILNHDDDILRYQLFVNGKLADDYNSWPGYFEQSAKPPNPIGGDAQKNIIYAFGSDAVAEVESILRKGSLSFNESGYAFAFQRHADLSRALCIPSFGVGAGFGSVTNGELPEGLDEADLVRVGEPKSAGEPNVFTEYRHIITTDSEVRNGEPCIRGLPIAVSDIYDYVAAGMTPEQIIAKHTDLTIEDVMACLLFIAHHYPEKS